MHTCSFGKFAECADGMVNESEKHALITSSSVFIPAGTKHCPLGFHGVQGPFRFFAVAPSGSGHYLPQP